MYVIWTVPVVLTILIGMLLGGGTNIVLFTWLNGLSRFTGDPIWANLTVLGSALLAFALVGPISARRSDIAWSLVAAGLIASSASHGLKALFDAQRPLSVLVESQIHVIGPELFVASFPSGHATTITTFATVLGLHIPNRHVRVALLIAVIAIGFSRVVVGAHWPADVLGGFIVGWLSAVAAVWIARRYPVGLTRGWQTAICVFSLASAWLFWDAPTGQASAVLLQRSLSLMAGLLGLAALIWLWVPEQKKRI